MCPAVNNDSLLQQSGEEENEHGNYEYKSGLHDDINLFAMLSVMCIIFRALFVIYVMYLTYVVKHVCDLILQWVILSAMLIKLISAIKNSMCNVVSHVFGVL